MTDPFDDARSGFTRLDDLNGRLLLIAPTAHTRQESTLPGQAGKKYDSVTATVLVCDGDVTDAVEEVPGIIEDLFFSGSVVARQLKPKVGKTGKDGAPAVVLGRLGQQPSRTRGFGPAWVLNPPTDQDKVLARKLYPRLVAAMQPSPDDDPFA